MILLRFLKDYKKITSEKYICHKSNFWWLDLKCINFSPKKQFKLTSGKKSPIYCDCRRIISFPKERKKLIELGIKMGAKRRTFYGLSGIGDLTLTCTSLKSRNTKLGYLLAKNKKGRWKLWQL